MKLIQLDFTFSNIQDITPPTTTKKRGCLLDNLFFKII